MYKQHAWCTQINYLKNALILEEEKMAHYAQEEKHIREENLRLQRRLQMEMERREALCRHLSESESRFGKLLQDIDISFDSTFSHGKIWR